MFSSRALSLRSFAVLSLALLPSQLSAQPDSCPSGEISGTVVREFNVDGNIDAGKNLVFGTSPLRTDFPGTVGTLVDEFTGGADYSLVGKDTLPLRNAEWGLEGITVTISDATGVLGSTQSGADGTWSFDTSALGVDAPLLVEFSGWASYLRPAPIGNNNGSSVVPAVNGECGIDFTVAKPADHCSDDPELALTCFVGEEGANGTGDGSEPTDVLVTFGFDQGTPFVVTQDDPECCSPANTSGSNSANEEYMNAMPGDKQEIASWADTGTVYGVAIDRRRDRIFSSAFYRPYTLPGSDGYGAIYVDDTLWLDLADLGYTVERLDAQMQLPINNVGFTSLGDLEIDHLGSRLFTINLATQEVVIIPIQPDGSPDSLNVSTLPAPVPAECNSIPSGFSRERAPFATAWHEDRLYVGVTCTDALSDPDGPHGFVFSTDLAAPVTWRLDASTDLNYSRYNYSFNTFIHPDTQEVVFIGNQGYQQTYFDDWGNEARTYPEYPQCGTVTRFEGNYNQPWLADIEFDTRPGRDDMVLGVRNRLMDIWHSSACVNGGALIRLCETGTDSETWTEEIRGSGQCGGLNASTRSTPPYEPDAPWFYEDHMTEGRGANGGLAQIPGFSELAVMATDNIHRHAHSGVSWLSNTDGSRSRDVMMLGLLTQNGGGEFFKSNTWGDVEAVCPPSRLEIGNLVWSDDNENGIQDAGEAGIAGVEILLYVDDGNDGLFGAAEAGQTPQSVLTDSRGYYVFSDSQHGLDWDSHYLVVIEGALSGALQWRTPVTAGVGSTTRDSNGIDNTTRVVAAVITGGPGENDHTYDFGFSPPDIPPIDISLEKSDSVDPVQNGEQLTYTFTVTNHSDTDANNVVVTDILPDGLTFLTSTACNADGQTVTCQLGTVAGNSTTDVSIIVGVSLAESGDITNVATASFDGTDSNPGNDSDTEITTVETVSSPPTVTMVSDKRTGTTTEINSCRTLAYPPRQFEVAFSEPMNNPPGSTASNDLTNLDNYLLVAPGPNGVFDTDSCSAASGDDLSFVIVNATAGSTDEDVKLQLNAPLPSDLYRLFVCDTLTDTQGEQLDGNEDGNEGTNFQKQFRIDLNNVVPNSHFDCDAGDFSFANSQPLATFSYDATRDHQSYADSGSWNIDMTNGSPLTSISRCFELPTNSRVLEATLRYQAEGTTDANSIVRVACQTKPQANCQGQSLDFVQVPDQPITVVPNGWTRAGDTMLMTQPASSAICSFSFVNTSNLPINLWVDNITVLVDFFRFNFEPGDTWAFSNLVD